MKTKNNINMKRFLINVIAWVLKIEGVSLE